MAKTGERDVVISPHFGLPALVTDVRYPDVDDTTIYADVAVADQAIAEELPAPSIPTPPSTFVIIEQKVRISADGTSFVDMTIDLPDIDENYGVDVNITKL